MKLSPNSLLITDFLLKHTGRMWRSVVNKSLSRLQVSGKRSEGKEADDFQGGVYEAAVNQEKQDDRRSHGEMVNRDPAEESDSGSEQEEVSVAALNVRTHEYTQHTHHTASQPAATAVGTELCMESIFHN